VNRKSGLAKLPSVPPTRTRRAADISHVLIATDAASRLERLQSVPLKFLRFRAIRDRTGLSRSTIWRLERRGEFPRHRRISANAVGWLEQEINDWMLAKSEAS
jgi:prophage regulatory protein